MSKDLVIAGVIVLSCAAVTAAAFVKPGEERKPAGIDVAQVDPPRPSGPTMPPDPGPAAPIPLDAGFEPFPPPAQLPPAPGLPDPRTDPRGIRPLPPEPLAPSPTAFPPPSPIVPPTLPSPPPVETGERTHVVAAGETLGDISLKYYQTTRQWRRIAEANKVDPDQLKVGQKLDIPAAPAAPAAPAVAKAPVRPGEPVAPALAAGERTYTVRKDDSFYVIAKRELGDASRHKEIEKLNGIAPEELKVGQVLKLPAAREPSLGVPTATPADPAADEGTTHVVAAGETLGDISTKHYRTSRRWREIIKANPGIDPERLLVGQKLKIPGAVGGAAAPAGEPQAPSAPAPAGDSSEYVVKSGDNLEVIAQRFYKDRSKWKKIAAANPGVDPGFLQVGQKLIIPDVKPAAPAVVPEAGFPGPSPTFAPPPPEPSPFAPPSSSFGPERSPGGAAKPAPRQSDDPWRDLNTR